MKFTTLEPLNQKFNEAIKEYGLKEITSVNESNKVILSYFNSSIKDCIKRIFDETNETCSQIFIRQGSTGAKYALVFISETDEPTYNKVITVQ